ncbi:hypothetical protein GWI33_016931 [Rhynchophorus ferrugineus]|uniref:Uncharacterized protein n=1 Tax=Rhynchophorus ferrugineus TaxID=354439 RepID=A0A834M4H0_RHYFE|nr:hypothetical protein GWI33_016931 [Rhynchophorus ferrugineus]
MPFYKHHFMKPLTLKFIETSCFDSVRSYTISYDQKTFPSQANLVTLKRTTDRRQKIPHEKYDFPMLSNTAANSEAERHLKNKCTEWNLDPRTSGNKKAQCTPKEIVFSWRAKTGESLEERVSFRRGYEKRGVGRVGRVFRKGEARFYIVESAFKMYFFGVFYIVRYMLPPRATGLRADRQSIIINGAHFGDVSSFGSDDSTVNIFKKFMVRAELNLSYLDGDKQFIIAWVCRKTSELEYPAENMDYG